LTKMNKSLASLSRQCGTLLQQQHCRVTTAESCTGGWIAQAITAVEGSSEWFDVGFVTYSNAAKRSVLQVPLEFLEGSAAPGAVSRETVIAMAQGALKLASAQFAVATSGIAGPGGGSTDKPVGTVCLAWASRLPGETDIQTTAQVQHFMGDRAAVRRQSVQVALEGLLKLLQEPRLNQQSSYGTENTG
jgi:nicotinamide-nucleotide amidase